MAYLARDCEQCEWGHEIPGDKMGLFATPHPQYRGRLTWHLHALGEDEQEAKRQLEAAAKPAMHLASAHLLRMVQMQDRLIENLKVQAQRDQESAKRKRAEHIAKRLEAEGRMQAIARICKRRGWQEADETINDWLGKHLPRQKEEQTA